MNRARLCLACLLPAAVLLGAAEPLPRPLLAADEAARAALRTVVTPVERLDGTAGVDVRAGTLADAVNGIARFDAPGAYVATWGDRLAVVALGDASYAASANPTARHLRRRAAGLRALARAREALASRLAGLAGTPAGDRLAAPIGGDPALALARLLRTYLVYDLDHAPAVLRVRVILVAAPDLVDGVERQGPVFRRVADVAAALAEATALARRGLAVPRGGQVLLGPTGEVVLVGYGTAVVRRHAEEAMTDRLRDAVREAALALARLGLVGLLQPGIEVPAAAVDGEEEVAAAGAAWAADEPADREILARLEQGFEALLALLQTREEWRDFTAGRLPSGVAERTAFSPDGELVAALVVYRPGLSLAIHAAATAVPAAGLRPDREVERGPTGRVTGEEDL